MLLKGCIVILVCEERKHRVSFLLKVSALAFSEDGKCFVTVGNRHVRFWYLEDKRSKVGDVVVVFIAASF